MHIYPYIFLSIYIVVFNCTSDSHNYGYAYMYTCMYISIAMNPMTIAIARDDNPEARIVDHREMPLVLADSG